MPKVKVTMTKKHTGTVNTGDIPVQLFKEMLQDVDEGNGHVGEDYWGLCDMAGDEDWQTVDIEVEEVKKK